MDERFPKNKENNNEFHKKELENLKKDTEEELINLAAKKVELENDLNKIKGSIQKELDLSTSENRGDQQSIPKQNLELLRWKSITESQITCNKNIFEEKKRFLETLNEIL